MSQKWRRIIGSTFLIGTLLLFGFGCQGLSSSQQAATRPVTLEYWTVFDDVDTLQTLIKQFVAARPYLTVNVHQLHSDELYPRLVEALAEDHGPDVISVPNRSLAFYESKLASLPSAVNDTTVVVLQGQFNNSTTVTTVTRPTLTLDQLDSDYVKAVETDVVKDGKIYGLPLSFDDVAVYYNKDLLDKAGIAEPPKTWNDFQKDVKKLTIIDKASGKIVQAGAALGTGANVPGSDDLLYILFKQSNLPFVDQSGRAVFNTLVRTDQGQQGAATSILNFYTDFANPARDTYTWNETRPNALDAFTGGSLAFFFGYYYDSGLIKARAPQLNYGVRPMFQLAPDNPINVANYWVQSVVAKSKHQNEAWDLVTYLTHSSATKDYLDKTGRPTAMRAYVAAQAALPDLAPFVSQELVAQNWYRGSSYAAAVKALSDMTHDWLQPPPDPNQLLQWRQQILDRAAATFNQTL